MPGLLKMLKDYKVESINKVKLQFLFKRHSLDGGTVINYPLFLQILAGLLTTDNPDYNNSIESSSISNSTKNDIDRGTLEEIYSKFQCMQAFSNTIIRPEEAQKLRRLIKVNSQSPNTRNQPAMNSVLKANNMNLFSR